jgi:hypothetical protein
MTAMSGFVHSVAQHIAACTDHTVETANETPFPVVQVEKKNIAFHLIELDAYLHLQKNTDRYFFSNLSMKFERQGMQLVHLWEDVWNKQRTLTATRIAVLLGTFKRFHARQTTIEALTNPTLTEFLQQHHLQVAIKGKYKYGLFLNNELLAVASFSAMCPITRNGKTYRSYELLRFANKTGCVVAGGLGKLLAHFVARQRPDDIMTYADRDWGTGRGYRKLNFVHVGMLDPQPFVLDCATFERYPAAEAGNRKNAVICYNSGSRKFLKIIG